MGNQDIISFRAIVKVGLRIILFFLEPAIWDRQAILVQASPRGGLINTGRMIHIVRLRLCEAGLGFSRFIVQVLVVDLWTGMLKI